MLLHAALPGLVFLASALVAWRWEPLGGALLLVEGMFVLVAYPFIAYRHFSASTILFVLVTMALPPLMAGGFLYLITAGSRGGAPVAGGA